MRVDTENRKHKLLFFKENKASKDFVIYVTRYIIFIYFYSSFIVISCKLSLRAVLLHNEISLLLALGYPTSLYPADFRCIILIAFLLCSIHIGCSCNLFSYSYILSSELIIPSWVRIALLCSWSHRLCLDTRRRNLISAVLIHLLSAQLNVQFSDPYINTETAMTSYYLFLSTFFNVLLILPLMLSESGKLLVKSLSYDLYPK
jgi:hypothetical protein